MSHWITNLFRLKEKKRWKCFSLNLTVSVTTESQGSSQLRTEQKTKSCTRWLREICVRGISRHTTETIAYILPMITHKYVGLSVWWEQQGISTKMLDSTDCRVFCAIVNHFCHSTPKCMCYSLLKAEKSTPYIIVFLAIPAVIRTFLEVSFGILPK